MEQAGRSRWAWLGAGIVAAIVIASFTLISGRQTAPDWFYEFPGVRGPLEASRITPAPLARIEDFERGGPHRLAILVTDPDSEWLGLARALRAHGVPFILTQDPTRALQHKVILAYPIISGRALQPSILRAFAAHVRAGGTLITHDLAGGGLEEVFGAGAAPASTDRERLIWATADAPPEEAETRFSQRGSEVQIGSYAYHATTAQAIARYEDGSGAILCRRAAGMACVVGVDIGALARRSMDGRAEPVARRYVNSYEPSLDVLMRWLRDVYVAGEPMPWLIDTAPADNDVSIVLTHDVDFTRSVRNAVDYAEALRVRRLRGTFFIQTKYVRDYNDDVFLTRETLPALAALRDANMEIGSHTVAHSYAFRSFPLGTGRERYPSYRPFVQTRRTAHGGTILGELRVSRFMLEHLVQARVTSFRPGELSYPFSLPEALSATGYSYSSSITANATLTHLPFQLTDSRAGRALSPVFEFPVTIEDEEAPRLGDRFDAANTLIEQIAAHHGVAVVLIHPDITDHKLAFEERLVDTWRERAWLGSLEDFGAWWRARDDLDVDVSNDGAGWMLRINGQARVAPIALILPKARRANGMPLTNERIVLSANAAIDPIRLE